MLAEARAPAGSSVAGDALALARIAKLRDRGALDPALSLIEQAGVSTSTAHFDLWMEISLLTGTEDRACNVLRAAPHLSADYGTRIFCAARARAWEDAALTLGSAQALKLLSDEKLALLQRFLDPELTEGTAPLPDLPDMDPLSFRLFEAIGEPLSTAPLARPYAVADLRNLSGWKAQLEAAERLTQAGALPDNVLLGLYSERKAAASGGVWDRVAAMQLFESALGTGSADAVAKTLPTVWAGMQDARLEVPFAGLFADRLTTYALSGRAEQIAKTIGLLSPAYENYAKSLDASFSAQIALGDTPTKRPNGVTETAIYNAFSGAQARQDLVTLVQNKRLGEAILLTLPLLHDGAQGNARSLQDALATLRALGLEDTARRAALQILLLER
mgnify:CR=1 FL=1